MINHVVKYRELWHVILHYVSLEQSLFLCYNYQFNFASHFCLSYYSTSVQKESPGILIAI